MATSVFKNPGIFGQKVQQSEDTNNHMCEIFSGAVQKSVLGR